MKKLMIAVIAAVLTTTAHAGFISGMVVGSMMSGEKNTNTGAIFVTSPNHDVITCNNVIDQGRTNMCRYAIGKEYSLSVYDYAGRAGYKFVHKIGQVIAPDGTVYIMIEVSK